MIKADSVCLVLLTAPSAELGFFYGFEALHIEHSMAIGATMATC